MGGHYKQALLFVAALCAASQPALAALRVESLWPTRTIDFVVCSSAEADPGNLKHCDAGRLLDADLTALVRQGVTAWNGTFAGHIQLHEVKQWKTDTVWIRAARSNEPSGCAMNDAGYARAAPRIMTIGPKCGPTGITRVGSVLHEIGHLVGLQHEQRRPDRDDYLIVNAKLLRTWATAPPKPGGEWDKRKGFAYQYTKVCDPFAVQPCSIDFGPAEGPASQFGREYAIREGPYDFDSVMHYSFRLEANDPEMTDVTAVGAARLQQQHLSRINVGQRDHLSAGDIAAIKALYP